MLLKKCGAAIALVAAACSANATVWINEIHYDNSGADVGEAVELAGAAGTSLNGWSLLLYNGANGDAYATHSLSGTIPATCGDFGVVVVNTPGLQNGSPDGIAVVDGSGTLVQFLSYEGQMLGNSGPATGMWSLDIGVSQNGIDSAGMSLQLAGSGTGYADFVWMPNFASTFGACNADQTFAGMDQPPGVTDHSPVDGAQNISVDSHITIGFSEDVVVSSDFASVSCDVSGPHDYIVSGGPSTYTLDLAADFSPIENCSVRVHAEAVADLDGTPDGMLIDHTFAFSTQSVGTDYYASADTSSAESLRLSLHEIIDDHQRYPYSSTATDTWDILEFADEDPMNPGRILDVYKNASYLKAGGGNTEYNREHTWPKSYGFTSDNASNYPYTDTHMLFLSDAGYNSSRNNKPYAECLADCVERVTEVNNGTGGGSGAFPGNSNWYDTLYWQTWGDRQGDVARAVLYMAIRYEGGLHGVTGAAEPDLRLTNDTALISSNSENQSVAYMGLLSDLLLWHEQDPPDAKERLRNEAVYSYQGNRNPFIDHPEWAAVLWGTGGGNGGDDTTAPGVPTGLVATAGDLNVALDWANNAEADLAGYFVYRSTSSGGPFVRLNTGPLASSAFGDSNVINGTTYYYVVSAADTSSNESGFSAQASATPTAPVTCSAGSVHVASVVTGYSDQGRGFKVGAANVSVFDNCGNPVSAAQVTGTFTGRVAGSDMGATDAGGTAYLASPTATKGQLSFEFCVDTVAASGLVYAPAENLQTCGVY